MAQVHLKEIRKSFGAVDVIQGVDLEIDKGEFVVFVGPSGCGKSTMLRMISGLEDVTKGTISIGGRDVTHLAPSKRDLAMVFQSYALFPHLTVAENIGFGLRLAKAPKGEIQRRVSEVAATLQLESLLDRTPRQLSGGQRQRVAIGRSIIRNPRVFLFDEPLSNLDAALRIQMRLEIARLHKSLQDVTMIYVTHDQVEAMTLADRIVVFRAGQVEQVGSPMELYRDPDNVFVAGFIGSPAMNFMKGITEGSKVRVPGLGDATIPCDFALPPSGSEVIVGLRPEHLSLRSAASPITVDISEQLGGVAYDYLHTPTGERIVVETDGLDIKPAGEQVIVEFNPADAFVFDASSELRLR